LGSKIVVVKLEMKKVHLKSVRSDPDSQCVKEGELIRHAILVSDNVIVDVWTVSMADHASSAAKTVKLLWALRSTF